MVLPKTFSVGAPRADLNRNDFDQLIYQKGRRVLYERRLQCPCKSRVTGQLPNCKNCGGTGNIFINARETRMLVTRVSVVSELKPWSEESRGMVNITCNDSEHISFMDRITLLDGNAIHTEVVHFKIKNGVYFGYTAYEVKNLIYAGLFRDVNTKLTVLQSSDLEFGPKNLIKIDSSLLNVDEEDVSITIRYFHAPVYYVVELPRETMQTYKYEFGKEFLQDMPLSAMARRAHYVLEQRDLEGTNILSNDFTEISCDDSSVNTQDCYCSQTIIIPQTAIATTLRIPFVNQNIINITHSFPREPQVSIYDSDGDEIEGEVVIVSSTSIRVSFNQQISGTIIVQ